MLRHLQEQERCSNLHQKVDQKNNSSQMVTLQSKQSEILSRNAAKEAIHSASQYLVQYPTTGNGINNKSLTKQKKSQHLQGLSQQISQMLKTADQSNDKSILNAKINAKSAEDTVLDLSKLGQITEKKLYETFTKRNQSQDAMSQKKVQFQADKVNFATPNTGAQIPSDLGYINKLPLDQWNSPQPEALQSKYSKMSPTNVQALQSAVSSHRFTSNKETFVERKLKHCSPSSPKVNDARQQSDANHGTLRVFKSSFKDQIPQHIVSTDQNLAQTYYQKTKLKSNQVEKDVRYSATNEAPEKKKTKLKKKGEIVIQNSNTLHPQFSFSGSNTANVSEVANSQHLMADGLDQQLRTNDHTLPELVQFGNILSQNNSRSRLNTNQNSNSPHKRHEKRPYYIDKNLLSSVSLDSSADNTLSLNDTGPQHAQQTFGELTQSESQETIKNDKSPIKKFSHSHKATLSKTPQVLVENQTAMEEVNKAVDKEFLKKQSYLKQYVKNNLKVYEQALQQDQQVAKRTKKKDHAKMAEHLKMYRQQHASPAPSLSPRNPLDPQLNDQLSQMRQAQEKQVSELEKQLLSERNKTDQIQQQLDRFRKINKDHILIAPPTTGAGRKVTTAKRFTSPVLQQSVDEQQHVLNQIEADRAQQKKSFYEQISKYETSTKQVSGGQDIANVMTRRTSHNNAKKSKTQSVNPKASVATNQSCVFTNSNFAGSLNMGHVASSSFLPKVNRQQSSVKRDMKFTIKDLSK